MSWKIEYIPESAADVRSLDGSQKKEYFKALDKVQLNPLSANEGGYGKPLGNKGGRNLTGLCKIKLKRSGLRVVYKLVRVEARWSSSWWACGPTTRCTTSPTTA